MRARWKQQWRVNLTRWLAALVVLPVLLAVSIGDAAAQACSQLRLTPEVVSRWHNPHPASDDFNLPLPMGLTLVFSPIPLGSKGLYGDERTTYKMGAREPRVFETTLEVRVGSSITRNGGETLLLIGKYEVTKAQYVAVMGKGNLRKGIEILYELSRDETLKELLVEYLKTGSSCENVVTSEIATRLSEPLTFLDYRSYIDFIDGVNDYCINTSSCRRHLESLGANEDYPGFVRLPSEHEWEFVARGGRDFVQGKITREQLQGDLPRFEEGKIIKDYAHLDAEPQRLLPIGSRDPLFGIYDMLGNARELMQNSFTAENGYGAVGAYVGRGGHFRSPSDKIRVSSRNELTAFRRDETTKQFVTQYFPYTGIRLVMGYPIVGLSERTGSDELEGDFQQTYVRPEDAGDRAGSTVAEAKDIGPVVTRVTRVRDRVGGKDDPSDIFMFTNRGYARLSLSGTADDGVKIEILDESEKAILTLTPRAGQVAEASTSAVLPGRFYLKVSANGQERQYQLNLKTVEADDTGVAQMTDATLVAAKDVAGLVSLAPDAFVGEGDRVDIYPIADKSSSGGLVFKATGIAGPFTMGWYDARQKLVQEVKATGDTVELVIPSSRGVRGFLRITAETGQGTTYQLHAEAKRAYTTPFMTGKPEIASPTMQSGRTYTAYLGPGLPQLYLPVKLVSSQRVRFELSDMTADVDLVMYDPSGEEIESSHMRPGIESEIFVRDLAPGVYTAEVRLKKPDDASKLVAKLFIDPPVSPAAVTPQTARRQAQLLGQISSGSPTSRVISATEPNTYYSFYVQEVQLVSIDVFGFSATSDIDIILEDEWAIVVAKSANVAAAPESIRMRLDQGQYYLRIVRSGSASNSYFTLNIEGAAEARPYDLSSLGNLVEESGDFEVRQRGDRCVLVTPAMKVEPEIGWRRTQPVFRIEVEKGNDSIWVSLDESSKPDGADLYQKDSINMKIDGKRVGGDTIYTFQDSWLKPLVRCKESKHGTCMSTDAIRGFRRGNRLEISGRTAEGAPASVMYSLSGYTKAAQDINRRCRAKADWIWR